MSSDISPFADPSPTHADQFHDEDWLAERRTEILRFMAEIERRTILSNLTGSVLIFAIAQLLPNASDFILPMLARFAAIAVTAVVYVEIRKKLALNQNIQSLYYACIMAGVVGGASWALLIAPVFIEPVLHPASFFVASGVLIAVSLVASSTASLPQIWAPFGLAFLITFWARMTQAPSEFALPMSIGVGLIYTAVAVFSLGAARQRTIAAEMLVENRRLGEDLAEALAQAEFLANRDPLTGLFNRRAMFENLQEISRLSGPGHIFLLDIDHFKQVNDRFGHDTGDTVLIEISKVLRDLAREVQGDQNFAARLGGEEFAVFLGVSDVQEADRLAEEVRTRIADVAREFSLPDLLGTASIGVATLAIGEPVGSVMARADKALYEAKDGGRNQVRRRNA